MNKYLYHVFSNGYYEGSGSLVTAEKLKKAIKRKHNHYNVVVEKIPLKKFKSGYR